VLLAHGWWMTHMTPRPDRVANYAWPSALGYDLLALTVVRLLWRSFNQVPELPGGLKPWGAGGRACWAQFTLRTVSSATHCQTFQSELAKVRKTARDKEAETYSGENCSI
jgi:cytochrome b561